MTILSTNLKLLRVHSGLNQKEMADLLGISDKNWSSYERGRTEPNVELLVKMANKFKISIDGLCTRDLAPIMKNLVSGNLNLKSDDEKTVQKGNENGNPKGNLTLNDPSFEYGAGNESLISTLKSLVASKEEVNEFLKKRISDLEKALKECESKAEKSHA